MEKKHTFDFESGDHVFFTSDTHFSHENIIRFCDRPFSNADEMNERLIENWNKTVSPDDTVFHLGDFCFGHNNILTSIRNRLNGHINLVIGNHDVRQNWNNGLVNVFDNIAHQMYISVEGQRLLLCHYPLLCYGGSYHNPPVWQLFGHVHSYKGMTGQDKGRLQFCMPYQYDVGVDLNNYRPISYTEVKEKINTQIENNRNIMMWL